MKKVCSLDFLNMQYFETDLKTADGRTVIQAGSKVTPELILKLYFRDIYLDDSVKVQAPSPAPIETFLDEPSIVEPEKQPVPAEISIGMESQVSNLDSNSPQAVLPDIAEKSPVAPTFEIPDKEPLMPDMNSAVGPQPFVSFDIDSKGPQKPEIDLEGRAPKQSIPDMSDVSSTLGPKQAVPDIDGVSKSGGPKQALPDMDEKAELSGPRPASKFMDLDDEVSSTEQNAKKPYSTPVVEPEPEPVEVNPVLKFDEQQAQRMAKLAVELGKLLNFSGKDLDDLRDSALYCNRGVISFRKDDTQKRDFEVHKALESAQMASIEGKISNRAVETIRLHPNDYESASFSLSQKIPHYHIIGIVYYYEKVLKKEGSKMVVLDRMLQHGGNKFNIFVLHKFINMMKDTNE